MMEHISDHEARVDELLPLTHRIRSGRLGAARAIGRTFQHLEDNIYDLYMSFVFELASGWTLDFWGWFAGEPRGGLNDILYKRLIRVALAAKYTSGNKDDYIRLWALATGGHVEFFAYPHKTVLLQAWVDEWMPPAYARRVAVAVRRGCPISTVVLSETLRRYVGDPSRLTAPLPAVPATGAAGAKVW